MAYDFFNTSIEYLKGVGPQRADVLKKELNIFTFGDLLSYYPFRYVDRTKITKINEINSEAFYVQLKGRITRMEVIGKQRQQRLSVVFRDDSGQIELVWFKGVKWIKDKLKSNVDYIVFGKPSMFNNSYNISHPDIDPVSHLKSDMIGSLTLQAFYGSTEKLKNRGLNSKGIATIIKNLIVASEGSIYENFPKNINERLKFISRRNALVNIHFPTSQTLLDQSIRRLKFEELFFIQLRLINQKLVRKDKLKGHVFSQVGEKLNNFYSQKLPFELTTAQKRVIKEIRQDLGSGEQMNRLLQGDVGSGKTMVALMAMLIALDNKFQAAIMAPTEILASQHYKTLSNMCEGLGLSIELLTGSSKTAKRRGIHEKLENGELNIIIGTHALLEEKVKFQNLGFVVIDEQHRFGVEQRAKLWKKNTIPPHVLVMTATPIPRTMAMTLYGDLDVSVIDELPPGRKPVKTVHFTDSARLRVFGFMKEQIKQGRQVYVVYPLINESEKLDLKDLMDGYESMARAFPLPEYAISIVHGKMKAADKEFEMQRFVKGQTQIMVSTTVIEVGVDVPNASIMIIENAERFGLSQLHQLRGRVGRGADQSFCILITKEKLTSDGKKRIQTMVETTDGFKIAETDLRLRGPGDMAGTQQSGVLDLKLADIIRDEKILQYARKTAIDILSDDPQLEKKENQGILYYLNDTKRNKVNWGMIS